MSDKAHGVVVLDADGIEGFKTILFENGKERELWGVCISDAAMVRLTNPIFQRRPPKAPAVPEIWQEIAAQIDAIIATARQAKRELTEAETEKVETLRKKIAAIEAGKSPFQRGSEDNRLFCGE